MNAAAFREWARLRRGKPDTPFEDATIAATARVHGLTVAMRNIRDFHAVVSRYVSWNPHGNSPVCFVDELPGMTKQSEKRLGPTPSPF